MQPITMRIGDFGESYIEMPTSLEFKDGKARRRERRAKARK